ncbi:hypothetical protein BJ138DRAFT_1239099 [Hygrophoropsis aurantiaca]|uniref:Uncharacterized protein n=1 Tax=Hygrophoropsis aurantiaca TaxID=72124 RepID=A0ACB7ZSX8_9AGAM|nr:hypothetical protein BJ138DRAFT_1239099 [Hygrophoropsis aurantiaca]
MAWLSTTTSTHGQCSQPLPFELERYIFILASANSPLNNICSYLLVARRVHCWTEKLLYQSVTLSDEERACQFISSLALRPDFAQAKVTTLCMTGSVHIATATQILWLCKGVTDLVLWIPPSYEAAASSALSESLNTLPLVRISFPLSLICGGLRVEFPSLPSIDLFTKITHLELLEGWVLWNSTLGVEFLPCLTHLSLCLSVGRTDAALLHAVLGHPNMQAMILRIQDHERAQGWLDGAGISDRRVVLVDQLEQEIILAGAQTTLWQYADHIVQQRSQ